MKRLFLWAALSALVLSCAHAEDLTLFSAAEAGADAWSWGGARVKASGDNLLLTENNRYGPYGDAFVSDHLPYIPSATIKLDVAKVVAGKYTLQAVCFDGASVLRSVDIVATSSKTGPQMLSMSESRIPRGTDSIVLKIWVVEEEGAAIELKDLTYSVSIKSEYVLLDSDFRDASSWEADGVTLTPGDDKAVLTLQDGKEFGSLLHNATFQKQGGKLVLIKLADVESARLTLQILVFDRQGKYLHPVDIAKDLSSGWHGFLTRDITWPEEAGTFRFKLWLSGDKGGSASPERLLVVAR
ncbi:MAG: hypothetical protein KJ626_11505 [Verrucomicrobia bacterium]|nr:hypothetical protein [Verrucomicrobiota bacterium]